MTVLFLASKVIEVLVVHFREFKNITINMLSVGEMSDYSSSSEHSSQSSDWYDSEEYDTGDEVPNPQDRKESLYQDVNKLPELLKKEHFQEGLLYLITLDDRKDVPSLGMIMETFTDTFL